MKNATDRYSYREMRKSWAQMQLRDIQTKKWTAIFGSDKKWTDKVEHTHTHKCNWQKFWQKITDKVEHKQMQLTNILTKNEPAYLNTSKCNDRK